MRFLLIAALISCVGCAQEARQPSAAQHSVTQQPIQPPLGSAVLSVPLEKRRKGLLPQERLPVLTCEGWLNGPPEALGQAEHRLTVLDCWGSWCSEVPKAIPGLKQLHEEFSPLGVQFVS